MFVHKSFKGFTLMEILIALVILSVGLLGIAALQSRGQQFNYAAYTYTQATFLAYDMMDRIRNNALQAQNGIYKADLTGACPKTEKRCQGSDLSDRCNPDELAQFDLYDWCQSLKSTLPGGEAKINWIPASTGGGPGRYQITLGWWGEDRTDKTSPKKTQRWTVVP